MTPAPDVRPSISLRHDARTISEAAAKEAFGLDDNWKPRRYVENQYEDRGEVVVDHATGLMWQKSDSPDGMVWSKVQSYVDQLNREQYSGFEDWRRPTIEELASLLEPRENAYGWYIDPVFNEHQWWYWSSDKPSSEATWSVAFSAGRVTWGYGSGINSVRAVRSWK